MLGAILAPWVISGLLAIVGLIMGAIIIAVFFMLVDKGCALTAAWAIGLLSLLIYWLS
jgi:hypothetical protein